MPSRQQFAHQGHVYRQLDKILSAMKAFAYAEVRKLEGQLGAHQDLLTRYRGVIHRLLGLGQTLPGPRSAPLLIVIGTERGFCGDINKRLAGRARQGFDGADADIVVLGTRLSSHLQGQGVIASLEGASNAEEVEPLVEKLLARLLQLDRPNPLLNTGLVFYDEGRDRVQVLPLFQQPESVEQQGYITGAAPVARGYPPLMYQGADSLLQDLVPEYVFLTIHYCIRAALLSENLRRLSHMDSATRHLDDISRQLSLKANQWRQETVIQEIEAHVAAQALAESGVQGR